jgi:hypothetical protein
VFKKTANIKVEGRLKSTKGNRRRRKGKEGIKERGNRKV